MNENEITVYFEEARPTSFSTRITITDIDIPDHMETVDFCDLFRETAKKCNNSSARSVYVNLMDSKKVFPNITCLIVPETYTQPHYIIPNKMFPNVRKVIYGDDQKCSGLLYEKFSSYEVIVNNVFCRKEDETVDLNGITMIGNRAFAGCMSEHIINTQRLYRCEEFAFNGSIFEEKAKHQPVVTAGSILAYVDFDCDTIEIPKGITVIRNSLLNNKHIHRLIIHDRKIISILPQSLTIDILSCPEFDDSYTANCEAALCRILSYEVSNNSFKNIGDVLYTSDGKTLVLYPNAKIGSYDIPDGVHAIAQKAFCFTKISKVSLPDSVISIGEAAFADSELEEIRFGTGITSFPNEITGVFERCRNLKSIDIPGTIQIIPSGMFFGCENLSSVTLHEGTTEIGGYAFQYCSSLHEIHLPDSITYVGDDNFMYVQKLYFGRKIPSNIMYSLYSARTSSPVEPHIKELYYNGDIIYLPFNLTDQYFNTIVGLFSNEHIDKIKDIQLDIFKNMKEKQEIAIRIFLNNPDDERCKSYLKRRGLKISTDFLESGEFKNLLQFLSLGLLSEKALQKLLAISEEKNDTVASSYIVDVINRTKQSKKNFRL